MSSEKIDELSQLILAAYRMELGMSEGDDGGLVHGPARPRHPANVRGSFKSSESEWMEPAALLMEWPTVPD